MYNPYIEFTSDLTDVGIVFSFEILFDSSSLVIKHINNYYISHSSRTFRVSNSPRPVDISIVYHGLVYILYNICIYC